MGNEQSFETASGCCAARSKEDLHRQVHKHELSSSTVDRDARLRHDMFEKGATKLHVAAVNGDELLVRKMLIANKSGLDATDHEGRTPFYMACKYGKENTAKALAQFGADTNKPDKEQKRPAEVTPTASIRRWLDEVSDSHKADEALQIHNYQRLIREKNSSVTSEKTSMKSNTEDETVPKRACSAPTLSTPRDHIFHQFNRTGSANEPFFMDEVNVEVTGNTMRLIKFSQHIKR